MKSSIFLVFFILFIQYLHAQEPDTTLQTELEEVYTAIDTTKLSTRFLYDKTVDLLNVAEMNGDSVFYNKAIYQLYLQAKNMAFDKENFISTDSIRNKTNDSYGETNPILITWYRYDRIKDSAFVDGLLDTLNGQVVDVQDPPESPYRQDTFFAFSPAFHTYPDKEQIQFVLSEEYYFSNFSKDVIDSISIDFDDGNGFQNVAWEDTVSVQYSDTSVKNIQMKLYSTGKTWLGKSYY